MYEENPGYIIDAGVTTWRIYFRIQNLKQHWS